MARQTGQFGAVYVKIGGVFTKIFDTYDWTFDTKNELLKIPIKMDATEVYQPSHNDASFTAKRIIESSAWLGFISDASLNDTLTIWRLDLIDSNNAFTQLTVQGFAETETYNTPSGARAEETFKLQISGDSTGANSWSFVH